MVDIRNKRAFVTRRNVARSKAVFNVGRKTERADKSPGIIRPGCIVSVANNVRGRVALFYVRPINFSAYTSYVERSICICRRYAMNFNSIGTVYNFAAPSETYKLTDYTAHVRFTADDGVLRTRFVALRYVAVIKFARPIYVTDNAAYVVTAVSRYVRVLYRQIADYNVQRITDKPLIVGCFSNLHIAEHVVVAVDYHMRGRLYNPYAHRRPLAKLYITVYIYR